MPPPPYMWRKMINRLYLQSHWVKKSTQDQMTLKFKEFIPIKSIFLAILVAFVVYMIPLNNIFVTAVSDLVNKRSHLQMKYK